MPNGGSDCCGTCWFNSKNNGVAGYQPHGVERLGECFAYGTGVEEDPNMAFLHFRRAAEMGNPKGQCYLGLCFLRGMGCHLNIELAFQWIMQAVESGHPIVIQILQSAGLDIARLSDGYKRSQKLLSTATGDRFGENFDRIFSSPKKSLMPVPPNENNMES